MASAALSLAGLDDPFLLRPRSDPATDDAALLTAPHMPPPPPPLLLRALRDLTFAAAGIAHRGAHLAGDGGAHMR